MRKKIYSLFILLLKDAVDAKFLSSKTAGGFVGAIYAGNEKRYEGLF